MVRAEARQPDTGNRTRGKGTAEPQGIQRMDEPGAGGNDGGSVLSAICGVASLVQAMTSARET